MFNCLYESLRQEIKRSVMVYSYGGRSNIVLVVYAMKGNSYDR